MTAHLEVLRQRDEARGRVAELEAMNTRLDRLLAKAATDAADRASCGTLTCGKCIACLTALNTPLQAVATALKELSEEECENGIEAIGETCSQIDPDDDEGSYRFEHWCAPCVAKALLEKPCPDCGGPADHVHPKRAASDNSPLPTLDADVFRPAALAAVAYLAAHAALAAAGVSEDRPAAARRVADAWIALTRACAELPAGGPEQDRGAAALRPAGSTDHAFLPHPWGKDICDAKIDDDGRSRTCAKPRREHGEDGHLRRCTENADDPACPHPTCVAGGEP